MDEGEQLQLVHDGWHTLLGDDSRLGHLLHGVLFLLVLLALYSPHLAEATSAHGVQLTKIRSLDLSYAVLVLWRPEIAITHVYSLCRS